MNKSEADHKSKLATIGCALCFHIHGQHEPGPVELHHLRTGGWGKGDYRTLIPLCYTHHRGSDGIHHIGTKLWEREYGVTQQQLLNLALENIESKNE
jgi:hypothetical protein